MDSKRVNAEIRKVIRPALSAAGFSRFTSRNSWRFSESRVEVINFQSFNSYLAESLGCTTYSFSVNLGSLMLDVPPLCGPGKIQEKNGQLLPNEYECQLRRRLSRSFPQPELGRRDTWYIDPHGEYLEKAIRDVLDAINRDALPWFESLKNTDRVLNIFLNEPEDMDRLWGFGCDPSPIRSFLTGYTAFALKRLDIAEKKLSEALNSGCFQAMSDQLRKDLEICGLTAG